MTEGKNIKEVGIFKLLLVSKSTWTLLLKYLVLMLIPTLVSVAVNLLVPLINDEANLYKVAVAAVVADAVVRTACMGLMVWSAVSFTNAKSKIITTTITTDIINTVLSMLTFAAVIFGRIWLWGFLIDELLFKTTMMYYQGNVTYLFITLIAYAVIWAATVALTTVKLTKRGRR